MRTISFVNQKGGVGKTTASVATVERLRELGYRTLLVDLDEQTNASQLAGAAAREGAVTTLDLLVSDEVSARSAVVESAAGDVIPADPRLSSADVAIASNDSPLTMLADSLAELDGEYDVCVIDCPPSLGVITRNAFVASDEAIIVVNPDKPSVAGAATIYSTVRRIAKNRRLNPGLRIAGFLVNEYVPGRKLSASLDETLPEIAEKLGTRVFETRIRSCEAVRQAQAQGRSVFEFAPASNAARDLAAFVDELMGDRR